MARGRWPHDKRPKHGRQRGNIARIINEPKYYGEGHAERNLKQSHRDLALLRDGPVICGNCGRVMHARIYRERPSGTRRGS